MSDLERLTFAYAEQVIFAIRGEHGGIHYWRRWNKEQDFGGVEIHYRRCSKPDYLNESAMNSDCWLMEECWHDGSSLMFYEFEDTFKMCSMSGDWDAMFCRLENMYRKNFEAVDDRPTETER